MVPVVTALVVLEPLEFSVGFLDVEVWVLVGVKLAKLAAVVPVAVVPDVMMMDVMALEAVELPDGIALAPVLHGVLVVLMMLVKVAVEDSMVAELLVKLDTDTLLVEVVDDKLAVA